MNASPPAVTFASKVTVSDQVMIQEVGGESVLLDLTGERYFGLDPVGTRIWALLSEHDTLQGIADVMSTEYDADRDRLEIDLLALAQKLAEAGLIKVE